MGQGTLGIRLIDGKLAVVRDFTELNLQDTEKIIAHLEIIKVDFLNIARELIVNGGGSVNLR